MAVCPRLFTFRSQHFDTRIYTLILIIKFIQACGEIREFPQTSQGYISNYYFQTDPSLAVKPESLEVWLGAVCDR